jgi:hypothetical protein
MPSASASSGSRTPAGVVFTSQKRVCSAVWPSSKVTRTRRSLTVALDFNTTPTVARMRLTTPLCNVFTPWPPL